MHRLSPGKSMPLAALVTLALAAPSPAATLVVTTRKDLVADDGLCSLREAVTAANVNAPSGATPGECAAGDAAPAVDTIRLRRGKYRLTRGGPGDDLNQGGDLDVTESLAIEGKKRTKIQNAIGDPAVQGDGDRLLHVDPAAAGDVDVSLLSVTLSHGDVGCTGVACTTGASAIEATGSGALALVDCAVVDNVGSCAGEGCGDPDQGAAIRAFGGGALSIRRSSIRQNRTRCNDPECAVGDAAIVMYDESGTQQADFLLEDTVVRKNSSRCQADGCSSGGLVSVSARAIVARASILRENAVGCQGAGCGHDNGFAFFARSGSALEGVEVSRQSIACNGAGCAAAALLEVQGGDGALVLDDVRVERNDTSCLGFDCSTGAQVKLSAVSSDVRVERLTLAHGTNRCVGESCVASGAFDALAPGGTLTLSDAEIANVQSSCDGSGSRTETMLDANAAAVRLERVSSVDANLFCVGDDCRSGAVLATASENDLTALELVLERSSSACFGTDCSAAPVFDAFSEAGDVALEDGTMHANVAECEGAGCTARRVFELTAGADVELSGCELTVNEAFCRGTSCRVAEVVEMRGEGSVAITGGALVGNASSCDGASCRSNPVLALHADRATLANSELNSNLARCDGEQCAVGLGGALHNGAATLEVSDTRFQGNATDGIGAAIYNPPSHELVLQRVNLIANQAGLRGTVALGGSGGAIYNDASGADRGLLRVLNSTFRENAVSVTGGAILNEGVVSTLAGSQFQQNQPNDCVSVAGGVGC